MCFATSVDGKLSRRHPLPPNRFHRNRRFARQFARFDLYGLKGVSCGQRHPHVRGFIPCQPFNGYFIRQFKIPRWFNGESVALRAATQRQPASVRGNTKTRMCGANIIAAPNRVTQIVKRGLLGNRSPCSVLSPPRTGLTDSAGLNLSSGVKVVATYQGCEVGAFGFGCVFAADAFLMYVPKALSASPGTTIVTSKPLVDCSAAKPIGGVSGNSGICGMAPAARPSPRP